MYRFFYPLFSLLLLLTLSQTVVAADRVKIEGNWKFQYGDDASWSQVNIDDSKWPDIEVPRLIKQLHKTPTIGWYRVRFDANVDIKEQQALLIENMRHADETWINGIRIGGEGKFEAPWRFKETNPQSMIRVYDLPAGFLKAKDNLLAIKVGIGFGNALGAMFPGGAGILTGNVYIGGAKLLNEYEQQEIINTVTSDVFFITLGIVEVFIILFLLRSSLHTLPEYKWLLFTSFIMLLASLGHDAFYIHGYTSIRLSFLLIIALLFMPISVALYFWAQYRNIQTRHVIAIAIVWAISSSLIIIPWVPSEVKVINWYLWLIFAGLFFSYALYCAIRGLLMGRIGAFAQLFGVVVFIISIRTQWLPENSFGHRNVQLGSLIYRYALLYAYFLQIRHMQLDYRKLSKRIVKIVDDVYSNIARELHDGIGQHLASIKLQTQLSQSQSPNKYLVSIEEELKTSIKSLRRLLMGLHPVFVDQYGIVEALEKESKHLEKTYDTTISLDLDAIDISKKLEHQIFRIFQECVNNAIKHGHSSNINIQLYSKNNTLKLKIVDDGIGFDAKNLPETNESHGFGFISLHERVALLNGQINIKSKKDKGTRVYISIPLKRNI